MFLISDKVQRPMCIFYEQVTWVEHVEVDDKIQTHRLYRDLICGSLAYGAERWIVTLKRMCERFAYSNGEITPSHEVGRGTDLHYKPSHVSHMPSPLTPPSIKYMDFVLMLPIV